MSWTKMSLLTNSQLEGRSADERLSACRAHVGYLAFKLSPISSVWRDELESVGMLAAWRALSAYDPKLTPNLASYLSFTIRARMIDTLRTLTPMPRRAVVSRRRLQKAEADLMQELGRTPTPGEIEAKSGLLLTHRMRLAMNMSETSIDAETAEGRSLHGLLFAVEGDADAELLELTAAALAKLPERSRKILALRFFEDLNLAEIGRVYGLTESRINQIIKEACGRLRQTLTSTLNQ